MESKNYIVLNGEIYDFVLDKPKRMNCFDCDLRILCEEKLDADGQICSLFAKNKDENGYMKLRNK